MALQKLKDDPYGNGGINYWKIVETNINWLDKFSHVTLAGYLSRDARLAEKRPFEIQSFNWSGDEFPFGLDILNQEDENIVHIAYNKIKESKLDEEGNETNFFADAKDC